jgi:hypothetical protein
MKCLLVRLSMLRGYRNRAAMLRKHGFDAAMRLARSRPSGDNGDTGSDPAPDRNST